MHAPFEVEIDPAVLSACARLGVDVRGALAETPLSEVGLDSLATVEVAMLLEKRVGVRLADVESGRLRTVGDLTRVARSAGLATPPRRRRRVPAGTALLQPISKPLIGWAFEAHARLRVAGTRHVPASGPVIVAANHRSLLDIPLLAIAVPRPVVFMATAELYSAGLAALFFRLMGGFPVDRTSADLAAMDTALAVVERGDVLGLYPEGTRSHTGRMLPFLGGAAWIALRTGAPIVPCGIDGSLPARQPTSSPVVVGLRPRRVHIAFGPPIRPGRELDPARRLRRAGEVTGELLRAVGALAER